MEVRKRRKHKEPWSPGMILTVSSLRGLGHQDQKPWQLRHPLEHYVAYFSPCWDKTPDKNNQTKGLVLAENM